jgi:hypothetical protein
MKFDEIVLTLVPNLLRLKILECFSKLRGNLLSLFSRKKRGAKIFNEIIVIKKGQPMSKLSKSKTLNTKLMILSTLLFSQGLWASSNKNYQCQFTDNGRIGKANIQVGKQLGAIELIHSDGHYSYQACQIDKDDFGTLIDCSEKDIDLMILLNDDTKRVNGGIMSSTHNLFLDLDC